MQGVDIVVERGSIPKRRRSKTVIEEVAQSKEVAEDVDSEGTDEEPPVRRRSTYVVIGGEVRSESDDEGLDHSKKLKGLETLSEAAQFKLNIEKARKASRHDFFIQQRPRDSGEGSRVTPKFIAVEDISSDEADITKKADEAKKAETEKDTDEKAKKNMLQNQGGNEQARDTQAEVHAFEPQIEKLKATKFSSSLTLSSNEFTSQFLNDNPDVTVNEVLRDPVEPEVQSMVDVLVT
ncbi:hypothetical protein Tco_0970472 [Tanacetum coccineum]